MSLALYIQIISMLGLNIMALALTLRKLLPESSHPGFPRKWKERIYLLLYIWRDKLPLDVIWIILEYYASAPLQGDEWRFIHLVPLQTLPPISSYFEERNGDVYLQIGVVMKRWFQRGQGWDSGWDLVCLYHSGPCWQYYPLHNFVALASHFVHRGGRRYGYLELNILTAAMYLSWGREKTIENLYYLWTKIYEECKEVAEGPLVQMICRCVLGRTWESFTSFPNQFYCINATSILRYKVRPPLDVIIYDWAQK